MAGVTDTRTVICVVKSIYLVRLAIELRLVHAVAVDVVVLHIERIQLFFFRFESTSKLPNAKFRALLGDKVFVLGVTGVGVCSPIKNAGRKHAFSYI